MKSMWVLSTPPPPADQRLAYGPDRLHFGDLRLPAGAGPHPVVVVIHGGFWRAQYSLDHIGHLAAALTQAGVATWTIEYRRLGDAGGGWPGTFDDVAQAVVHLPTLAATYPLDLSRVVTLGHSAGGHLALWVASRSNPKSEIQTPKLKATIPLAPVADLRRAWALQLSNDVVETLLGGSPDAVPDRYALASPIERLPLGVATTLIHGTRDDIVPFEIAQRYHDAARTAGDDVTLVPLPGAGHFEVIDPLSDAWPVVRAAVLAATAR